MKFRSYKLFLGACSPRGDKQQRKMWRRCCYFDAILRSGMESTINNQRESEREQSSIYMIMHKYIVELRLLKQCSNHDGIFGQQSHVYVREKLKRAFKLSA